MEKELKKLLKSWFEEAKMWDEQSVIADERGEDDVASRCDLRAFEIRRCYYQLKRVIDK